MSTALERVGGIQNQYAPSGYIGLWTRLAGMERSALTAALESRQAIQATLMRVTIHNVSAADFWPLAAGVRRGRREWFARINKPVMEKLDMPSIAQAVRAELTDGPLKQAELAARLARRGLPEVSIGGIGLWLDLVRIPPSGTWEQRRADLYGLADQWLPPDRDYTEEEGVALLIRRYLGGFGPARVADISSWAGVGVKDIEKVLPKFEMRIYRDEAGGRLVDLADGALPDEDTPAPVRFLPTWDATLLVHARRTQILPETFRPKVFSTRTPHSIGTFLVDGQVRGSWRYNTRSGRIETVPFGPLSNRARKDVSEEADRLAEFHAP